MYWTSFERSIDADDPSLECYHQRDIKSTNTEQEAEQEDVALSSEEVDDDASELDELSSEMTTDDDPADTSSTQEQEDEDVTIAATHDGNVVQCSSQVHNYWFCALTLSHLLVW